MIRRFLTSLDKTVRTMVHAPVLRVAVVIKIVKVWLVVNVLTGTYKFRSELQHLRLGSAHHGSPISCKTLSFKRLLFLAQR
jgi:hypothetical protein